jgi:hypothetical protein
MRHAALLLALGLAAAGAAAADTVYRCGPEGRDYSTTPCADGKVVPVDDSRTPAQRHDAEAVARRDAKLAAQMTHEREAREAAAAKTGATRIGPAPAGAPASAAHAGKKKKTKPKAAHKADRSSDLTPPMGGSAGKKP